MTLRERLQGTDGIRALAAHSTDPALRGLSPLQCLLERQAITEQFVELYAYAHVRWLVEARAMAEGEEIVVGWDPRDPEGHLTEAAVRGVRKAGATCVVLGVLPTPGVSFYLQHREAKGGIVITASHNFKDQNGIKIFLAPLGLKPLPADDAALTAAVYRTPFSRVASQPLRGGLIDASREAREAFTTFLLDPVNSWVGDDVGFEDTILVVDCANGAYSHLAPQVFRRLSFAEVVAVGADMTGNVNEGCGVVAFDGCRSIGADGRADTGRDLAGHEAVDALLRLAEEHAPALRADKRKLAAAVFDADGDRFYRLQFDPGRQLIHILSGDEVAAHQAGFLASHRSVAMRGALLVTTVESDIALVREAATWGLTPRLTVVGDKWVLLEAGCALLEAAISASADIVTAKRRGMWQAALEEQRRAEEPRGQTLCSLCEEIPWGVLGARMRMPDAARFAVGSEESGHTITMGSLTTRNGLTRAVFIGNGLKSAINTFAATRELAKRYHGEDYVERVAKPFPPGWKRTIYLYYTDKARLRRATELWLAIEQYLTEACRRRLGEGADVRPTQYAQEPDLLYVGVHDSSSRIRACVFCRNSGTEDRTGISIRGASEDAQHLEAIGDELRRFLLLRMKVPNHPYARAERTLLHALSRHGEMTRQALAELVDDVSVDRLLQEEVRQETVEKQQDMYRLTEAGRWYVTAGRAGELQDPSR